MASTFNVFVESFRACVVLAIEEGTVRSAENRWYGGVFGTFVTAADRMTAIFDDHAVVLAYDLRVGHTWGQRMMDECAPLEGNAEREPEETLLPWLSPPSRSSPPPPLPAPLFSVSIRLLASTTSSPLLPFLPDIFNA